MGAWRNEDDFGDSRHHISTSEISGSGERNSVSGVRHRGGKGQARRFSKDEGKPWMKAFGRLRHLRKETAKVNRIIEQEFEQIEVEDRL